MRHLIYSPLAWFLAASLAFWVYHVWTIWRRTEGGDQRAEGRDQRTEVRGQGSEAEGRRSEIGYQRSEVTTKPETRDPGPRPTDKGRQTRDNGGRFRRFAPAAGFAAAWLAFAFFSTPLGSHLLRQSLVQNWAQEYPFSPEYILVASMGYVTTDDPATNVLRDGTALRVAAAANWHREHPEAYVVMQGSSGREAPEEDHQVRLMAQLAEGLGVPEEKILLEPHSRNTREHVERILELNGISEETRIGVVTSDWHMRRTAWEFRSVFENVAIRPGEERGIEKARLAHLIPRENHLHASALYLREWTAIAYYRLFRKS